MESNGLVQHVSEPTHQKGHTLDVLITRQDEDLISDVKVVDPGLSDHYLVTCTIDFPKAPPVTKKVTYRKIRSIDIGKFQDDIRNRVNNIRGSDISEHVASYNSTLTEVLNIHAPLITKTIQQTNHLTYTYEYCLYSSIYI